ncbi:MAG: hypothetical protein MUC57_16790 [Desulfobacterales bacterium]|nr:hypothetical protein [Desulfobacterales bacterium]
MGDLNEIKKKRGIGHLDSPKMPFDYFEREYGTVPRDTKRATASSRGAMTPRN